MMHKGLWLTLVVLGCCLPVSVPAPSQDAGDPREILVEAVRPGVTLEIDKGCGATYVHGETVNVTIRSQLSGYLTLYDFTPDGTVQIIFPNKYCADNHVLGGETYTIPGNLLPFLFRVAPPDGVEMLFAVVTAEPAKLIPEEETEESGMFLRVLRSTRDAASEIAGALAPIAVSGRIGAALCQLTIAAEKQPVPENSPPTAAFTWSAPATGARVGDLLQFDASSSTDSDGQIVIYAWDWDSNGTYDATGASAVASHAFATTGSFRVTLRVTDDDATEATTSQTVAVAAAPTTPQNQSPTARFTWSAQAATPQAGEAIRFDAGSSSDPDGRITTYAWDWDSNGTYDSTGASPAASHTFSAAGSFHVTLLVTDDDGATSTTGHTLLVVDVGKVYALLIAIDEYPGTKNDTDGLNNAVSYLRQALAGWIDEVKSLRDSQATKAAILDGIRTFLGQAGPTDTVFVHFAGHGWYVPDRNGDEKSDGQDEAICPYDSVKSDDTPDDRNLITDDELGAALSGLRAGRVVIVLESCHSGTMERGLGEWATTLCIPTGTRDVSDLDGSMADEADASTRASGGPAQLWLQACGANETANPVQLKSTNEVVALFGYALSVELSDPVADANNDGWISFQEAFAEAAEFIIDFTASEEPEEQQTPQMVDKIGEPVRAVRVGS